MADQSQPIYSWRPQGAQASQGNQGNNYFGNSQQPQSFGQSLSGGVQAAGGAQSPFQAPATGQGGGFNVPGGNSAGFSSPTFAAAAPNDGAKTTPPPQSFGDALRSNPLSKPFPTSPTDMASQAALHSAVGNLQPNQGPSMSSMFALNEYNKSEAEAMRQAKESSALNGRADTGQISGDVSNELSQKLMPARQNFLGQLQGQEQQQAITKQQNAQNNIATLAGQANQASQFGVTSGQNQQQITNQANQFGQTLALNTQLGMGDLSLREKTLAQNSSQFKDQLSFQKYATDQGFSQQEAQRAWQATQNAAQLESTQKIAFAGLDLQQQQIANQAMQFSSNQDFQKWATLQGLDAETQKQVWQATQNEKDRQLQAGQGDLSRTMQKYIADQGFNLDSKKLDTQIQQFASSQDFQKWATKAGLDAETQKQVWQANQNDIQRKQDLGMQLTANEQQVRMQTLQDGQAASMAKLNQTLNLDTLDKQTQSAATLKTMDQNFQSLMTAKGYSHDEAVAATKQDYEKELQKMGYDQQTAMQASDQWFLGQQQQKQLDQTKYLAEAQLAQSYTFQMADLQQKYDFKATDVQQAQAALAQEGNQFAQQFGLDSKKFDFLKSSQAFQNLSDQTSTLMAMAGDNPDMLQFAAENFYKGMGGLKNEDGTPVMDPASITQGILTMKAASFKDPASFNQAAASEKNADGSPKYTPDQIAKASENVTPAGTAKQNLDEFTSFIGKTGAFSNADLKQKFTDQAVSMKNAATNLPTGKMAGVNGIDGALFDQAAARLRAQGIPEATIQKNIKRTMVGEWDTHASYDATQPAADYASYANMITNGLSVDGAKTAITKLLGADRAKAALALEGK